MKTLPRNVENAKRYLERGFNALMKGDFYRARQSALKAEQELPSTGIPKTLEFDALRGMRRFDEANKVAHQLNHQTPDARSVMVVAVGLKHVGRIDDAVRVMKTAVEMEPSDDNKVILAGYQYLAGDRDQAVQTLDGTDLDKVNDLNFMWLQAVVGDKKGLIESMRLAQNQPGFKSYVKTEVEFDKYRNDADFKAAARLG